MRKNFCCDRSSINQRVESQQRIKKFQTNLESPKEGGADNMNFGKLGQAIVDI